VPPDCSSHSAPAGALDCGTVVGWPLAASQCGLERTFWSWLPSKRAKWVLVAAASLRRCHECVLSQRRADHLRDVQEDRKHRLAATGLQRCHRCGHLLVPQQPAPGHHGAVGADAIAAGLRLRPISPLGIRALYRIDVGTKGGPNPETAAA